MKKIVVLVFAIVLLLCSGCETNNGGFSDYVPWWADTEVSQ